MNRPLADLTERVANRPDGIVLEGAVESLTASELLAAIQLFAASLQESGVQRLGLLAENSPAWVIVDLACQLAGICLIPLPQFFSDTQLVNSIESAGIDALLTDDADCLRRIVPCRAAAFKCGDAYRMTLLAVDSPRRVALPDGTTKITFTSGSTGAPRGVCLDTAQQSRVAQALNAAIGINAPRHLCLLPLSTLLENIGGVYVPLLADGTVIVPPGADVGLAGSTSLDIRKMLLALGRLQPTSIILLPQMLVALVTSIENGWTPPASLEFIAVGGGKVSPNLIRLARGAGLPVYEGYGLSETASVACLNRPDSDLPGSVGQPLQHVGVRIRDDEIVVTGNSFLGYLDDPDSWYLDLVATGDLGYVDEQGFVFISGRKKNVLISSFGRNINPEWVESQLLSHPILSQCFVFGDAQPCCVALLAPTDPACPDQEIQEWLDSVNSSLPDYARVRAWHRLGAALTAREGFITDNGRPRRTRIAQRHAQTIESLYPMQPTANAS
jgi:long-chain acyl-CoA synthetase